MLRAEKKVISKDGVMDAYKDATGLEVALTKNKLKQVRRNDSQKNEFMFKNDLRLLRIKYTRDYDIENILGFEILGNPFKFRRKFGLIHSVTALYCQYCDIGELTKG